METSVQEVLHTVEEPLKDTSAKQVFGEPYEAQGKTIIPVARVAYGFGGGTGRHHADGKEEPESTGGGGGAMAVPFGVLEITPEHTKLIEFSDRKKLVGAAMLGLAFGMLLGRRSKRR